MSNHGTAYPCTNKQLATIASRMIVALPQALELSGLDVKSVIRHSDEGERLSLALAEAFKMLHNGNTATLPKPKPPKKPRVWGGLLEEVGELINLPYIGHFVASEKFVEGETVDGVKIASIGKNFKQNLLGIREDNVKPVRATQQRKLLRSATSREVYTARGDNGPNALVESSIALVHVWEFLKIADRTMSYLFITHEWAVNAYWDGGGLRVGADPLDCQLGWYAGSRFVSR